MSSSDYTVGDAIDFSVRWLHESCDEPKLLIFSRCVSPPDCKQILESVKRVCQISKITKNF